MHAVGRWTVLPIRSALDDFASARSSSRGSSCFGGSSTSTASDSVWRIRFRCSSTRTRADWRSSGDKMVEIVGLYASNWAVARVLYRIRRSSRFGAMSTGLVWVVSRLGLQTRHLFVGGRNAHRTSSALRGFGRNERNPHGTRYTLVRPFVGSDRPSASSFGAVLDGGDDHMHGVRCPSETGSVSAPPSGGAGGEAATAAAGLASEAIAVSSSEGAAGLEDTSVAALASSSEQTRSTAGMRRHES